MVIVSSCFLGNYCKYNGGTNLNEKIAGLAKEKNFFAVCPETAGGLPVPRPPAEIIDGKVKNLEGLDVTKEFYRGSLRCLRDAVTEATARGEKIEAAILKARSPSCGSGKIYDGTFTGVTVDGSGVFAQMLEELEIPVYSEDTFEEFLRAFYPESL